MKHWIQAVLGENPFIPYDYYYDVVTWSYPLQRGLAGSGFLTQKLSPGIQMTEVARRHQVRHGADRELPGLRVQHGLGARPRRSRSTCSTRASTSIAACSPSPQGGKRFYTGAALVDGASLAGAGVNLAALAALADKRDTPVSGLTGYPVQRRQLSVPKIGVYTNSPFIPTNPNYISGPNVAGNSGHCALSGLPGAQSPSSYCEAMHALSVKLGLPASDARPRPGVSCPVTSADIAKPASCVNENFTALINPNGTIATTARHPARRSRPTGHRAEGVHQRRRHLRRHQRQRRQRRAHDQRGDAGHRHRRASTRTCSPRVRRSTRRSTRPTRSPGASTSAAGSTATPTATRCSTRPRSARARRS